MNYPCGKSFVRNVTLAGRLLRMREFLLPRVMPRHLSKAAFLVATLAAFDLAFSAEPTVTKARDCVCRACGSVHSTWRHEKVANFDVWTPGSLDAQRLAKTCETELERLRKTWQPESSDTIWQNKCVVVLHRDLASYQRAIGSVRDRSVGMATHTIVKGQIVSRRIDLRIDADGWMFDALPHELTHLVLADAVGARPLPRWLDEGLAVLAESSTKQARRKVELDRAVAAHGTIPTHELLTLAGFPSARQRDVFYSQSASLAAYLVERDGAVAFLKFARQSLELGTDAALRDVYGIADAGRLERLWKADLLSPRATASALEQLADDR